MTVTVAVTGDVPVVPVDPFDDPPPHPEKNPSPIAASASTSHRRFLLQPTQQNNAASADPGASGNSDGRVISFAAPEFVTVSAVVTAALLEGVTVAGLKPHVVFAGRPAHANATCPVNPFAGVTVTVTAVPLPFDGTETVVGLTLSEKSAGRLLIVYVAEPTALFEYPEATAIALIVSVAETVIAPVYCVDAVVGVLPSVV